MQTGVAPGHRFLLGALGAVLCSLCSCKNEHGSKPYVGPSAGVVASAPASSVARVPAPAPVFDPAQVRAFVSRWEAAQNEHDFNAYSALYAERFSGLKRVGEYAKRFDRKGWLRDRKPMFRDGVTVHASELELSGGSGSVRAVFNQDFSAPGFHDIGKKELFLVLAPGGITISREEMLGSRVAPSAAQAKSPLLAFHRDGPVLARGIHAEGLKGSPRLLSLGANGAYDVAVSVSPSEVDAASWLGREVTVYAPGGAQCRGSVSRLELRVSAVPHFGMRQAWAGETGEPKATPAQIAGTIWNMARDEERFLVGVLDKECHGVWALEHAWPFTAAQAPTAALRTAALTAFKALPRYHELQTSFAQEASDTEHAWETVDGELSVVEVRVSPQSALLVVSARGGTGCGGFWGGLTGVWAAIGSGTPQLALRAVLEQDSDLIRVRGAVDENADGALELLTGPEGTDDAISVLRATNGGYVQNVLFSTSVWDCGC